MITLAVRNKKYDVISSFDFVGFGMPRRQLVWTCFLRPHNGVYPTFVGVAISNPHEMLDDEYAKRLAFKRAVQNMLLFYAPKYPIWYDRNHKVLLAEFRRAYYFATKY